MTQLLLVPSLMLGAGVGVPSYSHYVWETNDAGPKFLVSGFSPESP